jgi:alpha-L-fucosidase
MKPSRRNFLAGSLTAAVSTCATPFVHAGENTSSSTKPGTKGDQRLSLEQLKRWESLGYGMFVHFGMSTYLAEEKPDGKAPATTYAPDKLDVDQWVSVARDAGMKYMVLTTKHVAGHCLWPSKHTDYTVANSTNKTNLVEKFCDACRKRGILPGLYYCSWDNHNRFGGKTPSDGGIWEEMDSFPKKQQSLKRLPAFSTSLYQNFQTAQITELLTQFGPIAETWIDIPGLLGRGYRTYLYNRIGELQPETVIMMNSGVGTGENYNVANAWPSDLIAIERRLPPPSGHKKWRTIEGKQYYIPGELCDPIGKEWFFVEGDNPRSDQALLDQFNACRQRGANFLLNVPPNKHGLIPQEHVEALMRLQKNAKI